jgi:hypothetical protein
MRGKVFDPSKNFGEIWGAGLEGYEQDGVRYNVDGTPYEEEDPVEEEVEDRKEENHKEQQPRPRGRPPLTDRQRNFRDQMSDKTDTELRTLVEVAGGHFTSRAAAISYLEAHGEEADR